MFNLISSLKNKNLNIEPIPEILLIDDIPVPKSEEEDFLEAKSNVDLSKASLAIVSLFC